MRDAGAPIMVSGGLIRRYLDDCMDGWWAVKRLLSRVIFEVMEREMLLMKFDEGFVVHGWQVRPII
jgi:hypothetical protein